MGEDREGDEESTCSLLNTSPAASVLDADALVQSATLTTPGISRLDPDLAHAAPEAASLAARDTAGGRGVGGQAAERRSGLCGSDAHDGQRATVLAGVGGVRLGTTQKGRRTEGVAHPRLEFSQRRVERGGGAVAPMPAGKVPRCAGVGS